MKALAIATLAAAAVLVMPTPAHAQVGGYVVAQSSATYAPLTGATNLSFTSLDEGWATITLPFTFTYFGAQYTSLGVSTNGLIFLLTAADVARGTGTSPCSNGTSFTCYGPTNLPTSGAGPLSSTAMKTFVAGWWDDLDGPATGGSVRYTTSATEVAVEFQNWDYFSSGAGSSFSFTTRFKDTGAGSQNDQIQIHYGAHSVATGGGNAQVGLQDPGTQAIPLLACGNTTARCTETNWPTNAQFTIDVPVNPELAVDSFTLTSFSVTNGTADIAYSGVIRNLGQNAGNNWHYKVYLSTDQIVDASDAVAYDSTSGSPASVAGASTVTLTGTGTVASLPTGNYYALIEVDTTNVLPELIETDNVGSSPLPYTVGIDLIATSISDGPASAGPGDTVSLTANVSNTGSVDAGMVEYAVVLSANKSFTSNTYVAHSGTVALSNGQSATLNLSFVLPSNVSGGPQHFGIVLDPSNAITETAENNNAAWSSTVSNIRQADLEILAVDLYDPVSGQVSHTSYMGDVREIRVTVKNVGQAQATSFNFGAILSRDRSLSLQPVGTDYNFEDVPSTQGGGYTLAAGATETFTFNITMPSTDRRINGQPLQTGDYYIFIEADSYNDVNELAEDNNIQIIHFPGVNGEQAGSAIRLYTQAPDLAVTKVQVPTATAVGEVVPVYRSLRNIGIQDAPALPYRFYASVNDVITEDDVPLEILKSDGTTALTADVTLLRNGVDTNTDFVRLPAGMVPGTYYIGVIIDPQNVVTELDEANNAVASGTTIQVAAPAVRVTTTVVSDAIVDRPYLFQLAASSTGGNATWAAANLPAGLSVEAATGIISGTPTLSGIFAFDVTATSGGRMATARLVMRVMENSTELGIVTVTLPSVVNSALVDYSAVLAAAGGQKPYTWKYVSGALPVGITVRTDGTVAGRPAATTPVSDNRVTVEVTDGVGNRARGAVRLRVVAPGSITISRDTMQLPNGMVSADYIVDLKAGVLANDVLTLPANALPLRWSIAAGSFPPGLSLQNLGAERGIIQGRPLVAGTYLFSLQVEDAMGRVDAADYVMRVFETHFQITAANLPEQIHAGDEVTVNLTSTAATEVTYEIYSGQLPPGLALSNGVISGQVDEDEALSVGTYNVVLTGKDSTGATGMGAVAIEVSRRPAEQGCSVASGSGKPSAGVAVLLFAAGLVFFRRSRKFAGLVAAIAVAFAPALASAQTNYNVSGPTNAAYMPLVAPTVLTVTTSTGATVNTPFPIKYYGTTYNCVGVSARGYATVGCGGSLTSSYNQIIPHSSSTSPSTAVFPWWDGLGRDSVSQISHATIGASPNRQLVIEWKDVYFGTTSTSRFSFQVRFYEGSTRVKFSYGGNLPGNASASVGIMGSVGVGVAGLSCSTLSTRCTTTSFPINKELDFSLPADLTIPTLTGDDTGYANVAYRATATLANVGGTTALQQKVRFYLSPNGTLDGTDTVLGDSIPTDVPANSSKTVNGNQIVIPGTTPSGSYFLLARADPDSTFTESDETNNVGTPFPVVVGPPTANLQPIQITTPSSTAVPGQTLTITRQIYNNGNAPATGTVKYTYFLSDNAVASYSDFAFPNSGSFADLQPSASNTSPNDSLVLPNDLPAGRYWLGICVDYDPSANPTSTVPETSEVDNCLTSSTPFVVSSGELAVITTSLPQAAQHSPYSVRLDAAGGNGTYQWSQLGGTLPPGMRLSADGFIAGAASSAGNYSVEVQVTSGAATKTATLSISVTAQGIPLAVVEQDLPTAEFGRSYRSSLVALGGTPPYIWTVKAESILPAGINVASDGTVEGRASALGRFVLSVEVADSAGVRAAREVGLTVANPTQLSIKTQQLTTAYVGKPYSMQLDAAGGAGGNTWKLVRLQKLAQGPTEVPEPPWTVDSADLSRRLLDDTFPPQLGLIFLANPNQPTAIDGIPTQAGLYALTLSVTDRFGTTDLTTLTLLISYDQALAITTTVLPDAFVGRPYRAVVGHNAAAGAATFETGCVQQVSAESAGNIAPSFSCAAVDAQQQLPPGLQLAPDGSLTGLTVAPEGFNNETPRVYSFLVKVKDTQGRFDVRGLSIKLRPNYEDAGGCSAAGAGPLLFAALGVLAVLRRRRS